MHMADGLLSPEVGVAMWAVTAGATAYGIKKITAICLKKNYRLWLCQARLFLQPR